MLPEWLHSGRVARPAPRAWNVVKTILQIVGMWGTFLFALPALVFWLETRLGGERLRLGESWRWAGMALFGAASVMGLCTGLTMALHGDGTPLPLDAPRKLVIRGPYRYIRNPMALFSLAQGFAVGLFLRSPLVLLYAVCGTLVWNYAARPWEEADLTRRFGEAYTRYRRHVRCWRVRLRPYDPAREAEEVPLSTERTRPPGRWLVIYDGECRFCRRRAATLARLGRLDAGALRSAHEPGLLDALPGVTLEACMEAMHAITPSGRVFAGPEAIVRLLAGRRAWGVLAWMYFTPGVRVLCDLAYNWVARHRYQLSSAADDRCGVCATSAAAPSAAPGPADAPPPDTPAVGGTGGQLPP